MENSSKKRIKKELKNIYGTQKDLMTLEQIGALIGWDEETYMPRASAQDCAEKVSLIERIYHEMITAKDLKKSVDYLLKPANYEKLNRKDKVVTRQLQRDIKDSSKLPTNFVEESAKAKMEASVAWQKAKAADDFAIFKPHLEKVINIAKQECKYINLPGHPYNSLLDGYERGMTVDQLSVSFKFLGAELKKLLKKIKFTSVYKKQSEKLLEKTYSQKKQEEIDYMLLEMMGIPEDKIRLDTSSHPFALRIGINDVRITTHYSYNPIDTLSSTLHEAGHALYALGMPEEYENTTVFDASSLGLDESQARFWENMVGKSESFWQYMFPIYREKFKKQLKGVSFAKWLSLVNTVKPSLIRIEADELTYCLHIILRFEIEKGLIDESIDVEDLPQVWDDKFEELLGIRPKTDREGVLQEGHWGYGSIGYFPTYAIGSIYAAQLYSQLLKERPSVKKEISDGKLKNVVSWLNENVHRYGRRLRSEKIIKRVCGEGLNPEVFIRYLHDKYSKIYGF